MSRIHEALKKAEQERATMQGGVQPVPAPPAMPEGAEPEVLRSAAASTVFSTTSPETMLARCPQREWKPDAAVALFMNGNDSARGTEEFRTLRSRLYQYREKMVLKSLLVTSALPKEGKSFTSSNLAQVFGRQHGRRVLLIDADLRGPRLHLMLGTSAGPGLSEYLQGQADEFSILQRGPMENLYFVPSGHAIADPAELVGNGRLKILLDRLGPLFDWVIVDSPPAIPVADASLLAKACDGVLLVVRSNSTPSDAARRARMEFPEQQLVGVVLNGTNQPAAEYERYYYEQYEKQGSAAKS